MKQPVLPLKTIGLLGGMSTQATKEYYRLINEGVNQVMGGHNVAELLIYSVNFQNIERFIRNNRWDDAGMYLSEKARRLELGGADFLFLGTNTMHKVREQILKAISIPFIDIIDVTANEIRRNGIRKVGLLGTYPTMTDPFYKNAYNLHGIVTVFPREHEMREIDRVIFDEMCHNQFLPDSKRTYLDVVANLRKEDAEGIVLACTEIKMLINQEDFSDFPVFDTTTLHCEKAVRLCVGLEEA